MKVRVSDIREDGRHLGKEMTSFTAIPSPGKIGTPKKLDVGEVITKNEAPRRKISQSLNTLFSQKVKCRFSAHP